MNKKILAVAALAVAAQLAMPLAVSAFDGPVGDISTAYGTPTIDGTIDSAEWANATKTVLNASNMTAEGWAGTIPDDASIEWYTMWDETNFYVAGKVHDATPTDSAEKEYGGDAVQLSMSLDNAFNDGFERAIYYSWGHNETGVINVVINESQGNDGTMDNVGKTTETEDSWTFEIALPWDQLKKHAEDKSKSTVTIKAGMEITAQVCYLDRDGGDLLTASMTSTRDEADWSPTGFGMTMKLAAKPAGATTPADTTPADTTPAGETTTPGAAQTADVAAVAVLALTLAAGAAVIISKKR